MARTDPSARTAGPIDLTFTATLGRIRPTDTWVCVRLPNSAEIFGTRGLVKVAGTVDGEPFRGAFMALGAGTHKLPVTAQTRKRIGKAEGDDVTVTLTRRLPRARPGYSMRRPLIARAITSCWICSVPSKMS
ncbi:MAG TPA: DUF1905 domain-containing protein [Acidimicrobiales bacterium]|nr:DUF1905 domain-containing protein [Acidimicrobiales bacterium]